MPLSWTQTIEQSQIIRSDAILEIKTNMDITYDKICYTNNSNIYASKFKTVYTSEESFDRDFMIFQKMFGIIPQLIVQNAI